MRIPGKCRPATGSTAVTIKTRHEPSHRQHTACDRAVDWRLRRRSGPADITRLEQGCSSRSDNAQKTVDAFAAAGVFVQGSTVRLRRLEAAD